MARVLQSLRPALSLVIPCYNEADGLTTLHARLSAVLSDELGTAEILFVNDGSTDATGEVISSLAPKEAEDLLKKGKRGLSADTFLHLKSAVRAVRGGVRRVHLVSRHIVIS